MPRVFAIGDIHGCCKTFKKLLLEKIQILKSDKIYCLGDYIDRGKDSRGVVDFIIKLRGEGYQIHTLRGNHEQMMMDSEKSEEAFEFWYMNGGKTTLQSFGFDLYSELPKTYKSFFSKTKYCIQSGQYIFVHAGLNFGNEDIFLDKEAMLWVRNFDTYQSSLGERQLIHGHTPIPIKNILQQNGNCINIDGGCIFDHRSEFGNLVAYNLVTKEFIFTGNCE